MQTQSVMALKLFNDKLVTGIPDISTRRFMQTVHLAST